MPLVKDRCLSGPWSSADRQSQDPEERKTKLAAELANGRLAMMAIIGRCGNDRVSHARVHHAHSALRRAAYRTMACSSKMVSQAPAWGDWSTVHGVALEAEPDSGGAAKRPSRTAARACEATVQSVN